VQLLASRHHRPPRPLAKPFYLAVFNKNWEPSLSRPHAMTLPSQRDQGTSDSNHRVCEMTHELPNLLAWQRQLLYRFMICDTRLRPFWRLDRERCETAEQSMIVMVNGTTVICREYCEEVRLYYQRGSWISVVPRAAMVTMSPLQVRPSLRPSAGHAEQRMQLVPTDRHARQPRLAPAFSTECRRLSCPNPKY